MPSDLTKRGIAALKDGKRKKARDLLRAAVKQNPGDIEAWEWLWGCVDHPREKRYCLEKVLEINPEHQKARRAYDKLLRTEGRKRPQPKTTPTTKNCAYSAQPLAEETIVCAHCGRYLWLNGQALGDAGQQEFISASDVLLTLLLPPGGLLLAGLYLLRPQSRERGLILLVMALASGVAWMFVIWIAAQLSNYLT